MASPDETEPSFFRSELLRAWSALLPEVSAEQSELLTELARSFEGVLFGSGSLKPSPPWQELGARLAQETGLFASLVWSLFEKAQRLVLNYPPDEIRRVLPLLSEATSMLQKGFLAQQKAQEEALFLKESLGRFRSFAGTLAHDLNNFLTIIQVHLDLIAFEAEETGIEKRETKEIQSATEKAIDYTRQILRLGQRLSSPLERLSSEDFLSSWLETFRASLPRGITLRTTLKPPLPQIRAEAADLGVALDAVAQRAFEAMPEGGEIRLTACTLEPLPCLPVSSPRRFRGGLQITLEDSGRGSSASEMRRAFFPLTTTKGGKKGAGLGLSLAYAIIEQHGGSLFLEAQPDVGTKATLLLPPVEP